MLTHAQAGDCANSCGPNVTGTNQSRILSFFVLLVLSVKQRCPHRRQRISIQRDCDMTRRLKERRLSTHILLPDARLPKRLMNTFLSMIVVRDFLASACSYFTGNCLAAILAILLLADGVVRVAAILPIHNQRSRRAITVTRCTSSSTAMRCLIHLGR